MMMQNDEPIINALTRLHVDRLISRFCETKGDRSRGGFIIPEIGFADSRNSIYAAQTLFTAYLTEGLSDHYGDPEMLDRLLMHLEFMKRRQRPDGSVSLWAAGVGSGSEIGFTLPGVCASYKRLRKSSVPGRNELLAGLEEYILRGAACVRAKEPHTSNHRWAAFAGPLAVVDSLFPDPRNARKIEEYLSDGIDIDSDGAFREERSPNYNIVAQHGLLLLVDYWARKDLLELVARNLRFVLEMRQPSGEAETLFSHRQDRGAAGARWGDYYVFKRLALELGDGVFASAADELLSGMRDGGGLPDSLVPLRYLFEDACLDRDDVVRQPLPAVFERRYDELKAWRFRDGDTSCTVVADPGGHFFDLMRGSWGGHVRSDLFFDFHVGDAIVDAVKIAWGSGTGAFRPESIAYAGDALKLSYVDPGWEHVAHYRPREKWGPTHVETDQRATVQISRQDRGGIQMRVRIGGWCDMPVAFILLLRENCRLTVPGGAAEALSQGGRTFTKGDGAYVLEGPGAFRMILEGLPESQHHLEPESGRSIPGAAGARCHRLVAALFTPVDFTLTLSPGFSARDSGRLSAIALTPTRGD